MIFQNKCSLDLAPHILSCVIHHSALLSREMISQRLVTLLFGIIVCTKLNMRQAK